MNRVPLVVIALVGLPQNARAQSVTVDNDAPVVTAQTDDDDQPGRPRYGQPAFGPAPQAGKLEAPFRVPAARTPVGPPPAAPTSPAAAGMTVAGAFLGALLGAVAGQALARHEIDETRASNSDSLNGPDEWLLNVGYGVGGVLVGTLVGAIVGHLVGRTF